MTILFTGRKAHLTPPLRVLATAKLEKLERLLGDILDAHVILKREKHRHAVEMVVKVRGRRLTAQAEAAEFAEAVGVCADRLLAQARKEAGRRQSRRKGRGRRESLRLPAVPEDLPFEVPGGDGVPEIVRAGRVPVRPMTLREALLRARDSEPQLLVFRDSSSQQVAILYRRPDGQYALVETET